MKIVVDRSKCTGLGMCESFAPETFEVNEAGDLVVHSEEFGADELDVMEQAVDGCPTAALSIEQ